jgi:hypothetical protein
VPFSKVFSFTGEVQEANPENRRQQEKREKRKLLVLLLLQVRLDCLVLLGRPP